MRDVLLCSAFAFAVKECVTRHAFTKQASSHVLACVCLCSQVDGEFSADDAVSLLDDQGVEFGRGLVNHSSDELARVKVSDQTEGDCWLCCLTIANQKAAEARSHKHAFILCGISLWLQGKSAKHFEQELGQNGPPEVIHR